VGFDEATGRLVELGEGYRRLEVVAARTLFLRNGDGRAKRGEGSPGSRFRRRSPRRR
jgi:hypothetical protein